MSKIDLSKAKIGDKFINREGNVFELINVYIGCEYSYELKDAHGRSYSVTNNGSYIEGEENTLDLVAQVFDKPLDELIQEGTKQIKESRDAIEEENEIQRRLEVVELADRIFFSERGSAYSFKDCIEVAEHSVNMINQYLKEGKL